MTSDVSDAVPGQSKQYPQGEAYSAVAAGPVQTKQRAPLRELAVRGSRALLWLLYAWVIIDLALLGLTFILLLFGANPDAGFADWVYRSSARAMAPFRGIFEEVVVSDKSVLDGSVLFAMLVYGLVALALHNGVEWASSRLRYLDARRREQEIDLRTRTAPLPSYQVSAAPPTMGQPVAGRPTGAAAPAAGQE